MPTGSPLLKWAPAMLALVSFCAQAGTVVEVRIEQYQFIPAEISVKAGDVVRWTNNEKRTSHSVVFPQEGGRESERLFPEENWARQFLVPGRYPYHCGPHPEMKGVVLVE